MRPTAPSEVRSLFEVALDNAAEGCGRELVGAMVNRHQAQHATEPAVRAAMAHVAEDEGRHADLSLALAAALMPKLTRPQRALVREAQDAMLEQMTFNRLPDAMVGQLGLMSEPELRTMTARLRMCARL